MVAEHFHSDKGESRRGSESMGGEQGSATRSLVLQPYAIVLGNVWWGVDLQSFAEGCESQVVSPPCLPIIIAVQDEGTFELKSNPAFS